MKIRYCIEFPLIALSSYNAGNFIEGFFDFCRTPVEPLGSIFSAEKFESPAETVFVRLCDSECYSALFFKKTDRKIIITNAQKLGIFMIFIADGR